MTGSCCWECNHGGHVCSVHGEVPHGHYDPLAPDSARRPPDELRDDRTSLPFRLGTKLRCEFDRLGVDLPTRESYEVAETVVAWFMSLVADATAGQIAAWLEREAFSTINAYHDGALRGAAQQIRSGAWKQP